MLRGVISLTKEEVEEALETAKKYLNHTQLENKLISALKQNKQNLQVQMSEQEVEQLIDNMDAPSLDEIEAKKRLRKSLQEFILHLKGLDD